VLQRWLHVQLDDDQLDDLFTSLCTYRDHFIELIESNASADTPQIHEGTKYWQDKAHRVQGLIDQISDELYGTSQRKGA